jgi:hypothetical protein
VAGVAVDDYSPWGLIYHYLLPGRAWARHLLVIIQHGPAARRYALRAALALPLTLVPAAVAAMWYLAGCVVWTLLHHGQFRLSPTPWSTGTLLYALVAIALTARLSDGDDRGIVGILFGAPLTLSLALLGLASLVVGLLGFLARLLDGEWAWGRFGPAIGLLLAALVSYVAFWAAGWTGRKAMEILRGGPPVDGPDTIT